MEGVANGVAVGQQSTGLSDISAQVQQYQQFLGESRRAGQGRAVQPAPGDSGGTIGGVWWIFRLACFCLYGIVLAVETFSQDLPTPFWGVVFFVFCFFFQTGFSYSPG
jgi:hypothetical protein